MEALDEATQLALALSISEAEASGRHPATLPSLAATAAPPTSDDEALARQLQADFDFDREQQQQQQQQQQRWAGGVSGPPSMKVPPPKQAPPPPAPAQPPQALPSVDSSTCAGCRQPLIRRTGLLSFAAAAPSRYLTALNQRWHPECFTCAGCAQSLASFGQFTVASDGRPYHPACHKAVHHPRCSVCRQHVPTEGANRIVWSVAPFWGDIYCPAHNTDGTPRCTACSRLKPAADEWAQLEDGRALCLLCIATIVPTTAACQPLYDDVLSFYASKGMPLPAKPPLMLVDDAALNAAENRQTAGQGRGEGPVFHTRGLCMTEYSTTVLTTTFGGGLLFGGKQRQQVQQGPARCSVTAILVLCGLPRLLTGSILAHECMHAWLRLSGYSHLTPQVEEGLCQLMALLWLEAQQPGGSRALAATPAGARYAQAAPSAAAGAAGGQVYEERLAAFLGNQIRTDPSVVYGDGLRAALDSFQRFGLQTLLSNVKLTGQLPG